MGDTFSKPGADNKVLRPLLCPKDPDNLYLPPNVCHVPTDRDFFLRAGTMINVKDTSIELRRTWLNMGFDELRLSRVGLVVIDAAVNTANLEESTLFFLGQRIRKLCFLSSRRLTKILPRIPIFVFPRNKGEAAKCEACLRKAELPANDIIIADHNATIETVGDSPMIERMTDRGLEVIHIVNCQNYFEVPCDPLLVGFMANFETDLCVKAITRHKWNENLPVYALKVAIPTDARADADEYSAILNVPDCDPAILQMPYGVFSELLRRGVNGGQSTTLDSKSAPATNTPMRMNRNPVINSDGLEPSAPTATAAKLEDNRKSQSKKRSPASSSRLTYTQKRNSLDAAFAYSVLPSALVSLKVLSDASLRSGRVADFCQRATALLMPDHCVATTYKQLETFFINRDPAVRDDSLLVILSLAGQWDEVRNRAYDVDVDERQDYIKEYAQDRCSIYDSVPPKFPQSPKFSQSPKFPQSPNFPPPRIVTYDNLNEHDDDVIMPPLSSHWFHSYFSFCCATIYPGVPNGSEVFNVEVVSKELEEVELLNET